MGGSSYLIINYYGRIYQIAWQRDIIGASFILAGINLFYTWRAPDQSKRWLVNVSLIVSAALAVTSYILFFVCLPKYTVKEAYDLIKEDPKYVSAEVSNSEVTRFGNDNENPFVRFDYTFDVKQNDKFIDYLYFNPMTGEYGIPDIK
jgi:hypothetical protein